MGFYKKQHCLRQNFISLLCCKISWIEKKRLLVSLPKKDNLLQFFSHTLIDSGMNWSHNMYALNKFWDFIHTISKAYSNLQKGHSYIDTIYKTIDAILCTYVVCSVGRYFIFLHCNIHHCVLFMQTKTAGTFVNKFPLPIRRVLNRSMTLQSEENSSHSFPFMIVSMTVLVATGMLCLVRELFNFAILSNGIVVACTLLLL